MKVQMLTSMRDIIDMEKKSDGIRHQVGGFDLIYHNGVGGASLLRVLGRANETAFLSQAMVLDPSSAYSTFLGTDIPRAENRKRAGVGATAR